MEEFKIEPRPVSVEPLADYQLKIRFEDGRVGIFDVKPFIRGNWYGRLKDIDYFNRVSTDEYTVVWPDGQDICPDCIYEGSITIE